MKALKTTYSNLKVGFGTQKLKSCTSESQIIVVKFEIVDKLIIYFKISSLNRFIPGVIP